MKKITKTGEHLAKSQARGALSDTFCLPGHHLTDMQTDSTATFATAGAYTWSFCGLLGMDILNILSSH